MPTRCRVTSSKDATWLRTEKRNYAEMIGSLPAMKIQMNDDQRDTSRVRVKENPDTLCLLSGLSIISLNASFYYLPLSLPPRHELFSHSPSNNARLHLLYLRRLRPRTDAELWWLARSAKLRAPGAARKHLMTFSVESKVLWFCLSLSSGEHSNPQQHLLFISWIKTIHQISTSVYPLWLEWTLGMNRSTRWCSVLRSHGDLCWSTRLIRLF